MTPKITIDTQQYRVFKRFRILFFMLTVTLTALAISGVYEYLQY